MKNQYYLFLLFSISVFTHAQELDLIQYSDISSIPQIVLKPKIQTELQTLLKHDYPKFQANFEHYSAPYLLKTDEALYYEGRSGSSLDASSTIVFKDGRLFAAIYFANTKTLKYFSNDASCSEQLHPAIQVFVQQREIQSIEYVTARVESDLKYHFGLAAQCEAYIEKINKRSLRK
ncbi:MULTISPECIES: hypothetical protein [Acinetobacter]|uniref:hypothetical protein n=1 Tax=Acinetobacter TaxID=469 RepID=UPI0002CF0B58|nr:MULTISPECIES: hypothetical protein [Acinetobacter]ENV07243.1 hypothetical protein F967_00224 [Acinetobacter sp. CIP 102637]